MKIKLTIETQPHCFEAEDEIGNILQDDEIRGDLESAIEQEIEAMMEWRDLRVKVEIKV